MESLVSLTISVSPWPSVSSIVSTGVPATSANTRWVQKMIRKTNAHMPATMSGTAQVRQNRVRSATSAPKTTHRSNETTRPNSVTLPKISLRSATNPRTETASPQNVQFAALAWVYPSSVRARSMRRPKRRRRAIRLFKARGTVSCDSVIFFDRAALQLRQPSPT